MADNFGAIILAAGLSSRMKAFKPLLPLGPMTMVGHCLDLFEATTVKDIIVVLGHRAEEVIPWLCEHTCRYVVNHRFREGMFSSMQAGIRELRPDCSGFFVLPVDIPLVKKRTVRHLLSVYQEDPARPVYYPCYNGKRGHPPLIKGGLTGGILNYSGSNGMRGFLRTHETQSVNVPVDDQYILYDADSKKDYETLHKMYSLRARQ